MNRRRKQLGPARICVRCHRERPHQARGMCKPCYDYSLPGRQRQITGNPGGRGIPKAVSALQGRREDYAWLRTCQGHSIEQAADRLGVTYRTACRYEIYLRENTADTPPSQRGAA